ncbi:hypothetical protein [Luteibacter sp. dw_328]|uniref:hypothetical protein n=1 Tax=Luteibacter sp. dw_328 TaxID=2719796 RepID=UPI001BD2005D|nr:hypothetical protein [Luteibacter sp. dw_328]
MHRLSGVIELLDSHSGRPAVGIVPHFRLNGAPIALPRRPEARYVLVDVAPGRYRLDVDAPGFLAYGLDFELTPEATLADAWLRCMLEPGPGYEYPPQATLIRGALASTRTPAEISARYVTVRGRERHVRTRCAPGGAYTLALSGQLADPTPVTLSFAFTDGQARELQLTVTPGRTHRAGAPL